MTWVANLSDGTTIVEQKSAPGQKSSWQALLDNLSDSGLKITGLRLQVGGITVVADSHKHVKGYCMAYDLQIALISGQATRMQGVGSVIGTAYGDVVFMNWIDETGNVRQEIRSLREMKPHTTLRDDNDNQETDPT